MTIHAYKVEGVTIVARKHGNSQSITLLSIALKASVYKGTSMGFRAFVDILKFVI
jgi:hypothetical protein